MVNHFRGKKVLVMGLGLHGGALSVVKWLLKNKAIITITDIKNRQQLKPSLVKISKLHQSAKIKYTLGKHNLADFQDQDLVIQNPGVSANSKYLKYARKQGIPVINEAVMFFGLYPGSSIGVTGTRGKSTVSTLAHKILKTEIKTNVVAGNIATNPMMSVVDKLKVKSLPVVELSSWQLENMGEYKVSPHIAVATNVMNDHLNRYKNFAEYKNAKSFILRHQVARDKAVLNADNVHSKSFAKLTKGKVYFYSLKKKVKGAYLKKNKIYFYNGKRVSEVMTTDDIKLLGKHNLSNILAAVVVAKLVGIKNSNIAKAVNRFRGVDYRLEYKGSKNNIDVYNDSTSTTPDAGAAAIEAMPRKKIILLAGGEDKELDYAKMARRIKSKVTKTVLLDGSGSKKLIRELNKIKYSRTKLVKNVGSLSAAWKHAVDAAEEGSVILFSPAAASFNMFDNEFDRARQFDKLFYGWQKKKTK